MRLLVLLERSADMRVPPERDPRSGRVRTEWLVRETDPGSARALELALGLKATRSDTEVTVVHLGPADAEPWLRQALAQGCDRAVRVWDERAAGVRAAGKSVILAVASQALGFDLALTGATGVVDAGGQLGRLLAVRLGVPCVTRVTGLEVEDEGVTARLRRGLDRGYTELVEASIPLVAAVSADGARGESVIPAPASVAALLAAETAEVTSWDLADLGVPYENVRCAESLLRYGHPRARRPRLHRLEAPDPALPTFDRILRLVEGSVRRRQGLLIQEPVERVVDDLFATLRDEGWLDHLRPAESQTTGNGQVTSEGPCGSGDGGYT